MQERKKATTYPLQALFGLPMERPMAAVQPMPEPMRGLSPSVRFFVDYSISVAVNSVVRKQAARTKLVITASEGLTLNVMISTLTDSSETKFVAYSNDMSLLLHDLTGLFVINQTPRELEHSIYLYLSERLHGETAVRAEIIRESNSVYGLPVLEGRSQEGPRSLRVKASAGAD
ncbi:MAG TPA: hypothetical protein V6D22_25930 [Candidatus Obscuribacterales bacterium]